MVCENNLQLIGLLLRLPHCPTRMPWSVLQCLWLLFKSRTGMANSVSMAVSNSESPRECGWWNQHFCWWNPNSVLQQTPQKIDKSKYPNYIYIYLYIYYIYLFRKKRKVNISQSSQSNKKGRLEPVRSLGKSWEKPGPSVSCLMRHGIDDLLFQALVPGTASGAVSWFFSTENRHEMCP